MATIPSSTSILRTLATKSRAPLFLPYSSRASSSTSPPSSFPPRSSFIQPTPPRPNAQSEFGLRPPEELMDPATQRAMSLPPHMRPRLLPVDKLSQTRIYVTNLPFDFPEDQLGALFENLTEVSPIDATHAPRTRTKNKTRIRNVGYGFVEWEDNREGWDAVWKAVEWSGKVEVEGKTLTIARAANKPLPPVEARRPAVADAWHNVEEDDDAAWYGEDVESKPDLLPSHNGLPGEPKPEKARREGIAQRHGGWDD